TAPSVVRVYPLARSSWMTCGPADAETGTMVSATLLQVTPLPPLPPGAGRCPVGAGAAAGGVDWWRPRTKASTAAAMTTTTIPMTSGVRGRRRCPPGSAITYDMGSLPRFGPASDGLDGEGAHENRGDGGQRETAQYPD